MTHLILVLGLGLSTSLLAPWATVVGHFETNAPAVETKLQDGLAELLREAGPQEFVPVIISMREQVPADILEQIAASAPSKAYQRQMVTTLLKAVADSAQADLLAVFRDAEQAGQARNVNPLWISNVVGAEVTRALAYQLAARDDIDYIVPERFMGPEVLPYFPGEDTPLAEIECGVDLMDADRVWSELNITGKNVVVGVVDTGICFSGGLTHPDLRNQLWVNTDEIPGNGIDDDNNGYIDDINGCSWENNTKGVNVTDTYGHGTHVSGTVAGDGTGGTQTGMAPDALVQVLKFWNSFSGQLSVWNCMQYGVDNGADVLTASLGWPLSQNPDRATWRRTCENAIAAGVVVVYAAGNEGDAGNPCPGGTNYRIRTPGDVPMVITVGATTCSDTIASFSSRGNVTWIGVQGYNDHPCPPGYLKPTIAAPGENTKSTRICSGYTNMSGTSMATPHVAGCIALMLSANPSLTHAQVKQILKDTAKDLGEQGPDRHFGAGRVNCFEAVKKAMEMSGKKGDLNCDDVVDFGDLDPFVLALSNPDEYRRQFPNCNIFNADCNNDGKIDFADINPFVELLGS